MTRNMTAPITVREALRDAMALEITISGPQGSGKTTVAEEIYQLLRDVNLSPGRPKRSVRLEDGERSVGPGDATIVIRTELPLSQ